MKFNEYLLNATAFCLVVILVVLSLWSEGLLPL